MIEDFIIQAGYLLDSGIIIKKINISEMSAVQLSALLLEHVEVFDQLKK